MARNVLFVTHSDRSFQEERASLNGLARRFAERDFSRLAPFESLPGVDRAVTFKGALSIWDMPDNGVPVLLGAYRPEYKVQYARWHDGSIVVLGHDRIEILDVALKLRKVIRHPLLVGGHVLAPAGQGRVWVTCAPGNMVFLFDLASERVERILPMPDRYGVGYPVSENTDLYAHYPPTDAQPTHVNSIWIHGEELWVTLCCQGAVGVFTGAGDYREVCTGYCGCHGGRLADTGELYLSDSTVGLVWFFDATTGQVLDRLSVNSRWVHDCMQVSPDLFACTLSDSNVLRIMSRSERRVVADVDLSRFGSSAMFVHVDVVPDEFLATIGSSAGSEMVDAVAAWGPDIFPVPVLWNPCGTWAHEIVDNCLRWCSAENLSAEYLAATSVQRLSPGRFRLLVAARCAAGGISVALEDVVSHQFVAVVPCSGAAMANEVLFEIENEVDARLVLSAFNSVAGPLDVEIECISLRTTSAMPSLELSADLAPEGEWECCNPSKFRNKFRHKAVLQLDIDVPVQFEYLFLAPVQSLAPGSYRVEFVAECVIGGLLLAVLDETHNVILVNAVCHPGAGDSIERFHVNQPIQARLVLCGGNSVAGPIKADVRHVALRKMSELSSGDEKG